MNPTPQQFKNALTRNLRSGKFGQTTGLLGRKATNEYCCLGVAELTYCELAGKEPEYNSIGQLCSGGVTSDLEGEVARYFHSSAGEIVGPHEIKKQPMLTEANDLARATFTEIADFIDQHPEAVIRGWENEEA